MTDTRVYNFARILVDYSMEVKPGERVGITAYMPAEPLVQALYALILERGAYPHVLFYFTDQEEILYAHANDSQLEYVPLLHKMVFEQFDVLIKVRAEPNPRALKSVDPARQALHQRSLSALLDAQMRRGADGSLRWMSTMFPTQGYAMEAGMGFWVFKNTRISFTVPAMPTRQLPTRWLSGRTWSAASSASSSAWKVTTAWSCAAPTSTSRFPSKVELL